MFVINSLENQSGKGIFIKYWDSIALFTILLIIAILRFSFLEVPLERDEGAYAYIAKLLLDEIPPYTQAYSLYFPGIFIIYALTFLVFGQTIFAIHFCLLIASLLTIIFIFLIGKSLFSSLTGIISGATFGLLGLNPYAQGLFSHGEPFTMLFICAGVYILLLGIHSKKKFLFILCGFFFGLGLLIKQNILVFAGLPLIYLCFVFFKSSYQNKNFWRDALLFYIFGYFIPLTIFFIFCLLTKSLSQMFFWTFIMPSEMTPSLSITRVIEHFKILTPPIIKSSSQFFSFAFIGLLAPLWNSKLRPAMYFIILFLFISFFTMCISFYLRAHYFIYLFPAIALLTGVGFSSSYVLIKKLPLIKSNKLIIIGLILLFFSYSILSQKKFLFQTNPKFASRIIYGSNPFPESLIIADYVKEHSSPEDKIAILGSEPQILFYSNRMSASKHIFTYYLMGNHSYALTMQKEFINDVELTKPPILINVVIPTSWLYQKDSKSMLFHWLDDFVSKNYNLTGVVEIQDINTTKYFWGENIAKFIPKKENFIQIYLRK
ncbi:MAG: hypothetical protein HN474_09580 [Nitrospina sp.]|nr:hypothetical protein [Nitrospina sp.]